MLWFHQMLLLLLSLVFVLWWHCCVHDTNTTAARLILTIAGMHLLCLRFLTFVTDFVAMLNNPQEHTAVAAPRKDHHPTPAAARRRNPLSPHHSCHSPH
jgi:hypothetical protein